MGQGDMPMTQADLSEQEELGSAHQLTKATGEQEEIRGKSTDLYLGCRTQVTSSVGHALSPWDQLHPGVKSWGSLLVVAVCSQ